MDGRVRVTGWLDREAAATVNAVLDPLTSPRRTPADDTRTPTQRRADALVDVCQALYSGDLPEHGGDRPHLVVTEPEQVPGQVIHHAAEQVGALAGGG